MNEEVVNAIHDLTRVIIALDGKYTTKSDAVRGLYGLGIPAGRIAAILAMKTPDVSSVLAKDKKRTTKEKSSNGETSVNRPR
jgi:hypothetical protein